MRPAAPFPGPKGGAARSRCRQVDAPGVLRGAGAAPHLSARLRPPERVTHGAAGGGGAAPLPIPLRPGGLRQLRSRVAAGRQLTVPCACAVRAAGWAVRWRVRGSSPLVSVALGVPVGAVSAGRRMFVSFYKEGLSPL